MLPDLLYCNILHQQVYHISQGFYNVFFKQYLAVTVSYNMLCDIG